MDFSQFRLPVMGVALAAAAGSVNAAQIIFSDASTPLAALLAVAGALMILGVGRIGYGVMAQHRQRRMTIARRLILR